MAKTESTEIALFTRPELAKLFGKDARTIARWLEDGLPVAVKGRGGRPSRYHLPDVVRWVIERELQARGVDEGELSPSAERAKLDLRRREELELRIKVRRGELVELEAVQAEFVGIAAAVKARLRAIPDAVADRVVGVSPAKAKALLLAKIDEALSELARGYAVTVQVDESDEDEPPASVEAIA